MSHGPGVRRAGARAGRAGQERRGDLLGAGHRGHPGRGRHPARDVRADRRPRRLRQPGVRAGGRQRHAGHDRHGRRPVDAPRSAERDDQDSGDHRGHSRRSRRPSPPASTSTSRCCSRSSCTRRSRTPTSRACSASSAVASRAICRTRASRRPAPMSVASFFVSRVDTPVDKLLGDKIAGRRRRVALRSAARPGGDRQRPAGVRALPRRSSPGAEWDDLAAQGAEVQRPLWASTSTKNPRYRDVRYVEELIGPDTVNTLPPATLEAFKDHGRVSRTVDTPEALERARKTMRELKDGRHRHAGGHPAAAARRREVVCRLVRPADPDAWKSAAGRSLRRAPDAAGRRSIICACNRRCTA